MSPRIAEVESTEALIMLLERAERASRRPRAVVQSVDLDQIGTRLDRADVSELVFLGCDMAPKQEAKLVRRGALVFPEIPNVPFDPYRGELYSAAELFGTDGYAHSTDATVYAWFRSAAHRTATGALAMALHDHAIVTALDEALHRTSPTDVVGVMGGHAMARGTTEYRDAALLARALARAGKTVLTGGGPGAMEAANLGAYLAPAPDTALDEALAMLASVPDFRPSIDAWAAIALEVRARWPNLHAASVGIPTWFYGHEPPNPFGGGIAKFFANPVREATLLERCGGGIVFLHGAAGTVQEIFTDACENYYAAGGAVAPMVLVGEEQWTTKLPAWQLLTALASDREMADHVHLVSTVHEAFARLVPSSAP